MQRWPRFTREMPAFPSLVKSDLPVTTRIALVAHDAKKDQMVDWAKRNAGVLRGFEIFATGTTGTRLSEGAGLATTRLLSGRWAGMRNLVR